MMRETAPESKAPGQPLLAAIPRRLRTTVLRLLRAVLTAPAPPEARRQLTAGPRVPREPSRLPRIPFGRKMMNSTSRTP